MNQINDKDSKDRPKQLRLIKKKGIRLLISYIMAAYIVALGSTILELLVFNDSFNYSLFWFLLSAPIWYPYIFFTTFLSIVLRIWMGSDLQAVFRYHGGLQYGLMIFSILFIWTSIYRILKKFVENRE